jgi:hypothetical protein
MEKIIEWRFSQFQFLAKYWYGEYIKRGGGGEGKEPAQQG